MQVDLKFKGKLQLTLLYDVRNELFYIDSMANDKRSLVSRKPVAKDTFDHIIEILSNLEEPEKIENDKGKLVYPPRQFERIEMVNRRKRDQIFVGVFGEAFFDKSEMCCHPTAIIDQIGRAHV